MRPLRVELEGIGSFRGRTDVDLSGVDLFALSGPTGAGKTTLLVDAMMLALYGTIPRYDDRRLVAPAITQGANEGRVRLTFSVGDRTFTATRVVRRTRTGATTKEARLEEVTGGGSVVHAGSADDVTAAVERLLGLNFDQFCRSVVLPQGAFDRFLFAKPSERGDLLLQLLDLRVHDEVGRRARAVATQAAARADAADRRLQGDLASTDPAELDRLADRARDLEELATRCAQAQTELDELTERGGQLRAASDAAAADRDALASLARPDDVDAIADAIRSATDRAEEAERDLTEAASEVDAAESARAGLPAADLLAALARAGSDLTSAREELPALTEARDRATAAAERAAAALRAATDAVDRADAALDAARRRELVHALTDGLHAGDDCPVCGSTLADLPATDTDGEVAAATADLRAARTTRDEADRTARETDRAAATAAERADAAAGRVAGATAARDRALAAIGTDEAGVAELVAQVDAADAALETARQHDRAARRAHADARTERASVGARADAAWQVLDRARDAVGRLSPPSPDRRDLGAAWDQLLAWAEATRPDAVARADEAAARVDEARARYSAITADLRDACRRADVDLSGDTTTPGSAVAGALASTRAAHARLSERLADVRAVTAERDAARDEADVADHLGKLLRADGFSRWLLARALQRLVSGASTLLRELSSGAYSLALDDSNQFLVLDHRNADEPRTVRSLSGGERFLASLALALALADHVADLAAEGAARLESLFLDEGFGTLDPDTLDVVAAALEELGARGRVVGIVTHVRDLAERLPVRFEVRKGPEGSTVHRIDEGAAPAADPAGDPALSDTASDAAGDTTAGDTTDGDTTDDDAEEVA